MRHSRGRKKEPVSRKTQPAGLENEDRFEVLAEASFEGIAIHSNGIILEANDVAMKMFGYGPGEVIGMSLLEFMAPESRGLLQKSIGASEGKAYEFTGLRKDGSTFFAEARGKTCVYRKRLARIVAVRDITERRQAEKIQREAAGFYLAFMQASPDAVIIADLQGHILHFSQKCVEMFGYKGDEHVIGKSIFEFAAAQDLARAKERYPLMLSAGGRQEVEFRLVRKNGQTFTGEVSTSVLRNESGNPNALVIIIRDITEKKEVEKSLREATELYQQLVKAWPDSLFITDFEGKVLEVSERARELYNFEDTRFFQGKNPVEFIVPEDRNKMLQVREKILAEGFFRNVEFNLFKPDGSTYIGEVSAALAKDAEGNPKAFIATVRDITERKQAEAAVKEAMELFKAFLNASPDAVGIVDLQGRFIEASQKMAEFHGFEKAEQLAGMNILDLVSEKNREKARLNFQNIIENKDAVTQTEFSLNREDGSVFIGELSCAVVKVAAGKPKAVVGIMRDITERKKAEQALAESESQLRLLADGMTDLIGQIDEQGRLLYASPSHKTISGYDLKGLIGKKIFDFVHPEDLERIGNTIKWAFETKKPAKMECQLRHKDGHYIWLEIVGKFLSKEQGRAEIGIYSARDITQRRAAEQALKESEERYRMLAENASDTVWMMDMNFKYTYTSTSRMSGYTKEEMLKMTIDKLLTPESLQYAIKVFKEELGIEQSPDKDLHRKRVLELAGYRKDGAMFLTEATVSFLRDKNNKAIGIIGVTRDITERKKAEQALKESEERFRTLISSMDDLVFTLDRDLRYTEIHGRELDKYPALRDVFLGKKVDEVFKYEDGLLKRLEERERSFQRALEGENVVYEWSNNLAGETLYFQTRLSPLRNAQGEISGIVGVARDVTERKKMAENQAKAEKLDSLGVLAGGIAHDFNNILTAIVGNISMAKIRSSDDQKVCASLDEAEKAAMHAKELTQQLLTFSKGGEPVKKVVSAVEMIKESANLVLIGSRAECEFSISENLWPICADEGQMTQVFNNLLLNASQAMPEGGIIKVKIENEVVGEVNEWQLEPGNYVRISIQDQGVGIPPQYLTKIFDPYFTTKSKGSGLGLTITYSVVNKHKGHIYVDSKAGMGSTFYLLLPATKQKASEAAKPVETPFQGRGKILIMDDDDGIRRVCCTMLEHMGYQVVAAREGREAIASYQKAKDSGHPFDAVIIDLMVNDGVGGIEAMRILREIDPQIKALVASGYSTDPVMADYKTYGFCGAIAKPFGMKKLGEALHALTKTDRD